METFRSLLRWSFAMGALLFLAVAVVPFLPRNGYRVYQGTPLLQISVSAIFAAIALIFVMAFWTTRKPTGARNGWAIAAGSVYLLLGVLMLYLQFRYAGVSSTHSHTSFFLLGIGIASIIVFALRTAPPAPVPVRVSVPGDRTHPWAGKAFVWLGYAAIYGAAGFWIKFARAHEIDFPLGVGYIVLIVLGNLTATILHEGGHAVAAWIFEMKVLSFEAGPFRWKWRAGIWSFKFLPSRIITPAGAVGVAPTNRNRPLWHDISLLAAAPFVNLITGLAALYVALHSGSLSGETWQFIAFFASSSLIAAVQNMLPFLSGTTYTDGARIVQLVTGSPMADLWRVSMDSQSTLVTAFRARDTDIASVRRACDIKTNDLDAVHLRLLLAHSFEDAGDTPQALAALVDAEDIYARCSIDLPAPLHTCFIISHALLNRDTAAARLWWNRMQEKKPSDFNVDYWLARASLLWVEGNLAEAEVAWHRASAEAMKLPHAGAFDSDRDRCVRLRRELDLAMLSHHASPSAADALQTEPPAPADRFAASPIWTPAPAGTGVPAL